MKSTVAAITVVAVTWGVAGCTFRSHATSTSSSTSTAAAVSTATPAVATSGLATVGAGGLFEQGSGSPAVAPVDAAPPVPTILLPVPPLPADMQQARPSTLPSALEPDEHDHAADELTARDVAAEWIAAVYTGRYDDPPNAAAEALRSLAAADTLIDEALATVGPVDVAVGEARWPYIVDVADAGNGWWQASVLVKSTRSGHVGPASTPVTVRVHVTDALLVDDWEQTP